MPYRLAWEHVGVYRTYYGELTDADRRDSLVEICGNRRFDDLRYAITDFLAVARFIESPQATLELAALNLAPLRTNPHVILAAVATDPVHIGYIRRFKSHGFVQAPYEYFPTAAMARQWVEKLTGIRVNDQGNPVSNT